MSDLVTYIVYNGLNQTRMMTPVYILKKLRYLNEMTSSMAILINV